MQDSRVKAPLRILHLEDNPQDRQLVEQTLAADGLVCNFVRVSEREPFEVALKRSAFDVIVSECDGYGAANAAGCAGYKRVTFSS